MSETCVSGHKKRGVGESVLLLSTWANHGGGLAAGTQSRESAGVQSP